MLSTTRPEDTASGLRRPFIKWLLGFSIVATLGGVLTPIIGYLWPPARKSTGQGSRVRVASLAELEAAGGLIVPVEDQPVVLTIGANQEVNAFSAICTHLGCVIKWESTGRYIVCPCHDGRFNAQTGAVISGPPPGPLPRHNIIVDDDDVYVIL
jgi:cytochrome b6-f complex iron-sulfur subunit